MNANRTRHLTRSAFLCEPCVCVSTTGTVFSDLSTNPFCYSWIRDVSSTSSSSTARQAACSHLTVAKLDAILDENARRTGENSLAGRKMSGVWFIWRSCSPSIVSSFHRPLTSHSPKSLQSSIVLQFVSFVLVANMSPLIFRNSTIPTLHNTDMSRCLTKIQSLNRAEWMDWHVSGDRALREEKTGWSCTFLFFDKTFLVKYRGYRHQ